MSPRKQGAEGAPLGNGKFKFAMYWAGSCGGCEIALLEIKEKIVEVDQAYDVVFWPAAADFKYKDLEGYDDGFIDVCLFNGCIRNSENEHIAKVLRDKSKVLVAFGACASMGGIPGLANLSSAQEIKDLVYAKNPSVDNPDGVYPQEHYTVPEGELDLPHMYDTVKTLDQTVPVDYYVPGCAPEAHQIAAVLDVVTAALKGEGALPPKGAVVGVAPKVCCDECERLKEEKKIAAFRRIWEFKPDPEKCLLEQGLICMGPATRAGCGARCTGVGMPCRGCYGAPADVIDQGAKMLSTVASIVDAPTPEEIAAIAATVPDPVGTFYRFGLPSSLLRRARAHAPESEVPA
jgi:F420-non-reducing hydrogenase small subunit